MDTHEHLRALTLLRKVGVAFHQKLVRETQPETKWSWRYEVLVQPEIKCGFCQAPIKANKIWVYDPCYNKMIGEFQLLRTGSFRLQQSVHPHCLNSATGDMCLGTARTLLDLLTSPPNLNGLAVGRIELYNWYQDQFHHQCQEMKQWALDNEFITEDDESYEEDLEDE